MKLFQVDAFAGMPFSGNPAAVCLLDKPANSDWMQSLAAEMNLSETAFVHAIDEGWSLRWFTPQYEVDLCGHATLASAHILWEQGIAQRNSPIRFQTLSGWLECRRNGEWIEMDFPSEPPKQVAPPAELLPALSLQSADWIGRNRMDYFVMLSDENQLRNLHPDSSKLRRIETRGIIVTARSKGEYDFLSRFFAPGAGIDEDPVTGSAHCALAPFWSERLGRNTLCAYQASKRGGVVRLNQDGDRVVISGQALTMMELTLTEHALKGWGSISE